jgi:hypothetical protein
MAGSCECDKEMSVSEKAGNYLEELKHSQFVNKKREHHSSKLNV